MIAAARVPYEACPLCDATSWREIKRADCRHHALYKPELPHSMRWLCCERCDHVFVDGYFTEHALEVLFSDAHPGQRPGAELHQARLIASRMVERVRSERDGESGRWLDVGFGNGALMTTAEEYGFEVAGLDLRTSSVDRMRRFGYDARTTPLTELASSEPWDVVSMADSLEHMPWPRAALEKARDLLHADGLLMLSMPNRDCFVWRQLDALEQNPYWAEIEHYHNFGKRRLYALLEETGFEPVRYGVSERYYICMEVIARRV